MGNFLGGGSKLNEDGIPKRSGVGGVVNGVLETLGDMVLVQSGLKPVFGPQHQQNRINTVMQGYEADPEGTLQKVRQIDPDYAENLRKSRRDDRIAQDTSALRQAQINAERGKGYEILGSMAGATNAENFPQMAKLIQSYAAKNNLELPEIPTEYNENFVQSIKTLGIDPYQQERLTDYDEAEQNDEEYRKQRLADYDAAEEGRMIRARESQDRQDARSARSIAARGTGSGRRVNTSERIREKVLKSGVDSLNENERVLWDRLPENRSRGNRGSGRGGGTTTAPAPKGKLVIRNGKLVQQ